MSHPSIPDPAAVERGHVELVHVLRAGGPLDGRQAAAVTAVLAAAESAREALAEPDPADPYARAAGVAWSLVDSITRQLAALGAAGAGAGDEAGDVEHVDVCGICREPGGRLVLSHDGPDGYLMHPACDEAEQAGAEQAGGELAPDVRPLHVEPVSVRAPHDVRPPAPRDLPARGAMLVEHERAIRAALAGVELGAYDERMIGWLSRWDVPTVATVVSLLGRARAAGGAR